MPATSVTGRGLGSSKKYTVKDLAILANGPAIHIAGSVESGSNDSSPPSSPPGPDYIATVTFPSPLEGSSDNYVISLTTQNGGYAYVIEMLESNGNFSGFSLATEAEGTVMYLVVSKGSRPIIVN